MTDAITTSATYLFERSAGAIKPVPPPLRILQVVPTYYPAVRYGGPIRSIHELSAALVRRGHVVSVFTTNVDGEEDSQVPLDRPVDLDGVALNYFAVPALRRLYWAPALAARLRKAIGNFDIVHLHSMFLWPTYVAARIATAARVPYLMSPRGMLGETVIRRKSRLVKSAWIQLIERRSLARAAAMHVTAEIEAAEAEALGLSLPRRFCVPNGVSSPARPAPLAEGPFADIERPYALFLSRINRKKGLDRLIRAWSAVRELPLMIVGNDDEHCLPELEALVRAEGISHRVRFLGAASDTDKWALYQNAEMFILPSHSENFGNVVAEAMAMACPVVVTPGVGLATLVAEVGAGLVTEADPTLLAAAINALHGDPARRRACGEAGRAAARDRLSWSGVAERMEQEYRRITDRGAL
jgi:glycosyltransferase involved in cell wall biosynthesis